MYTHLLHKLQKDLHMTKLAMSVNHFACINFPLEMRNLPLLKEEIIQPKFIQRGILTSTLQEVTRFSTELSF